MVPSEILLFFMFANDTLELRKFKFTYKITHIIGKALY